jgi:plastocyanin
VMSSGSKFQHTFTTAGSFPYFCEVHLQMMTGTITVNPQ